MFGGRTFPFLPPPPDLPFSSSISNISCINLAQQPPSKAELRVRLSLALPFPPDKKK